MMKMRSKSSKFIALLLTLTLVFVAGCQAIGGVDLNQVLKNSLKVSSMEGTQTLEFQLQFDEEMLNELPEEETALIKMVSHIKLELDQIKVQDNEHFSFEGNLLFGDETSIGFAMQMSDKLAVFELEGAKQPFVLDLDALAELEEELTGSSSLVLDEESLLEVGHNLIDVIGDYAINNLPNPSKIKVNPTFETINGVNTSLMHVQAELDGKDIWAWIKKYVDALAEDRAGLDRMIEGVMEILASNPEIWESMGVSNPLETGMLDAPTQEELVQEASDTIAELLVELKDELKEAEKDEDFLVEVFNEALVTKVDLYVDSKLDIRKQLFELSYTVGEEFAEDLLPLKGVSIKSSSESWNVNSAVKADAPNASESAVDLMELSYMEGGYTFLKLFESDSVIYDVLKNKLDLGRQTYTAYNDDYFNPPIIVPGYITIVPIRDVADAFGAEITYDAATKTIELYDEATDTTIAVQVGSDIAVINGERVQWSFPTTIIEGTGYVAARSLSEALGATIEWETLYEDWKVLTIERVLE